MSKRAATRAKARGAGFLPPDVDATEPLRSPLPGSAAVATLLFGSGFCALVYQVAWQREFRLVFGASTAASAAVLAVFMGGLGLGAALLGPRADRRPDPLRFYALLELGVALSAAATPRLLDLVRAAYIGVGGTLALGELGGTLFRLVLASLVLAPPTLLAGGTLGAAARAAEDPADRPRRATALLYGANTLGAVSGCLASTFWMLETFGTRATLWLAALANLAVAGTAAALSRHAPPVPQPAPEPVEPARAAGPAGFVRVAAGVAGFVFFLMELVWYRMLGPILGGTVYSFGLVLAVALFGVAAGGLVYPAAFARARVGLGAFATTCLLEAGALALPFALGDEIALLAARLRPAAGAVLADYLFGWTSVTAIVVLPAAVVAGVQFPLLVALLGEGREGVARQLGGVYLWNTAGAIGGALLGGFGLLPLLTAPGCWRAAAAILVVLGLAALVVEHPRSAAALTAAAAGAAFVTTLLAADGPSAAWRHGAIGVGRAKAPANADANAARAWINDVRRSIVWEREGIESSVALQAIAGLSFVLNGKVDGNARNDAPTQVMGGLLGALLRPDPRRALVIGLGTGSTAGWLAEVPSLERVDVVELEPAILDVARACAAVNRGALQNPRVRVVLGDAREVLLTSRERYDLVFSEPSNPYRAGVASLFTREFYEAVAARLGPDGVLVQWLQAYDVDAATVAAVASTLADVFPAVEVWQVHQVDLLLVAARRPLVHEAAALRARIRQEPFRSALRVAWRATELEDLLARFVAAPAWASDLRAGGHEPNRDDRNLVEFSFARTLSRSGLFDVRELRRDAARIAADRPAVAGAVDWARVEGQRLAIYTIAGSPAPVPTDASPADRLRAQAHAQYAAGELAAAVASFTQQDRPPEGPVETTLFAEGLADAGDPAAVPRIRALAELSAPEAEAATARLAFRLGQHELARNALVSAFVGYRSDPWPNQVAMSHALALASELAAARPETTAVLFETLGQPFAAAALEEPRRVVRLALGRSGGAALCREALHALEPHVPWRSDLLRVRADCYQRTGDPLAAQARRDLGEFLAREPAAR